MSFNIYSEHMKMPMEEIAVLENFYVNERIAFSVFCCAI